jgi:hypothetical protein
MPTAKFLCLVRFQADHREKRSSPEEMQAMYSAWYAFMAKFAKEFKGQELKPGGALMRGGTVTDGPYIEAKEVLASYALVEAPSLERAIEILKESPLHGNPSACVEIRELGHG